MLISPLVSIPHLLNLLLILWELFHLSSQLWVVHLDSLDIHKFLNSWVDEVLDVEILSLQGRGFLHTFGVDSVELIPLVDLHQRVLKRNPRVGELLEVKSRKLLIKVVVADRLVNLLIIGYRCEHPRVPSGQVHWRHLRLGPRRLGLLAHTFWIWKVCFSYLAEVDLFSLIEKFIHFGFWDHCFSFEEVFIASEFLWHDEIMNDVWPFFTIWAMNCVFV